MTQYDYTIQAHKIKSSPCSYNLGHELTPSATQSF